jgi:hypothetical protein
MAACAACQADPVPVQFYFRSGFHILFPSSATRCGCGSSHHGPADSAVPLDLVKANLVSVRYSLSSRPSPSFPSANIPSPGALPGLHRHGGSCPGDPPPPTPPGSLICACACNHNLPAYYLANVPANFNGYCVPATAGCVVVRLMNLDSWQINLCLCLQPQFDCHSMNWQMCPLISIPELVV